MTPDRFAALAEAYGGDVDRWPMGERDAARRILLTWPEASALLAVQAELDVQLAGWKVTGPGAALSARIAGVARRKSNRLHRLRLFLSGFGAAATLAGGIAAGASMVALPNTQYDHGTSRLYEVNVLGAPVDVSEDGASEGQM